LKSFHQKYIQGKGELFQRQLTLFGEQAIYKGEKYVEDLFEAYLRSENHMDGCIWIESDGAGVYSFLIVKGKLWGQIWQWEYRSEFYPVRSSSYQITTFDDLLISKLNEIQRRFI